MDKKKVEPLKVVKELLLDRIILQAIKQSDIELESGIVIPAFAAEKSVNLPKFGYVVAAGPGDPNKGEMKVKVGDKVCYAFYSGIPMTVGKVDYLIMRDFDVLFILND